MRRRISRVMAERPCRVCEGRRLRPEILAVRIEGGGVRQGRPALDPVRRNPGDQGPHQPAVPARRQGQVQPRLARRSGERQAVGGRAPDADPRRPGLSGYAQQRQTGRDLHEKYKETSLGGLAVNVIEC